MAHIGLRLGDDVLGTAHHLNQINDMMLHPTTIWRSGESDDRVLRLLIDRCLVDHLYVTKSLCFSGRPGDEHDPTKSHNEEKDGEEKKKGGKQEEEGTSLTTFLQEAFA